MSNQFSETPVPASKRMHGNASEYSALLQKAMRYDKLRSSDYPLVMSILNAVTLGYTEERWKEEQKRTVNTLTSQAPDQKSIHADAANRYEQTVSCLKDLALWPW